MNVILLEPGDPGTYAAQRDGARAATSPSTGWNGVRNRPTGAFTH